MKIKKIAAFEKTLSFPISMSSTHKFKILIWWGTRYGDRGSHSGSPEVLELYRERTNSTMLEIRPGIAVRSRYNDLKESVLWDLHDNFVEWSVTTMGFQLDLSGYFWGGLGSQEGL